MFLVYVVLCLIVFGCQYQCNWLPGKTRLLKTYYVSSGTLNPTLSHSWHVIIVKINKNNDTVVVNVLAIYWSRVQILRETWGINLVKESRGTLSMVRENTTVLFILVQKDVYTRSLHVVTKQWWKGVGVGKQEPTRSYVELVLAPQMGQGFNWTGNSVFEIDL